MKKKGAALLLAALCGLSLTGCEMVSVNREKDRAQAIIQVGDTTLTKEQVYAEFAYQLAVSGYSVDMWDEDMDSETREYVNEQLVDFAQAKADLLTVAAICDRDYPLTEDDQKKIDEQYNEYISAVKTYLGYDEEKPEAYEGNLDEDIEAFFASQGTTSTAYKESVVLNYKYEKVREAYTETIEADETTIRQRYDEDLAEQKEAAITNTTNYETTIQQDSMGDYLLFKAKNYAVVKQVLIPYTKADAEKVSAAYEKLQEVEDELDEATQKLSSAKSKLSTAQSAFDTAKSSYDTAQQNNDADAMATHQQTMDAQLKVINEQKAIVEEQQPIVDQKTAEKEQEQKNVDAAEQAAYRNIQAKVEQMITRYKAGEDFAKLIEEYNTDPGMQSGAFASLGYTVSPNNTAYDADFAKAARALTEAGQISDPVLTVHGAHVIRAEYNLDAEVELPYETVRAIVKEQADADAQEEAWTAQVEQWRKDLDVKTWTNRLKFIK